MRKKAKSNSVGEEAQLMLPTKAKELPLGCGLVVALAFFALSSFLMAMGTGTMIRSMIARSNWTPTPATIEFSQTHMRVASNGAALYTVDLMYRYKVGDTIYTSTAYGLGEMTRFPGISKEGADAWVRAHPTNSSVTAYIDPKNPSSAAIDLKPDVNVTTISLMAIIPIFVGIAILQQIRPSKLPKRVNAGRYIWVATAWGAASLGITLSLGASELRYMAAYIIYFGIVGLALWLITTGRMTLRDGDTRPQN